MLRSIAEDVSIHQSDFCRSNCVVVQGRDGVLLIDPGVHGYELTALANELSEFGHDVVAGFSTHPHWDHLLWHSGFGAPPRYGTARCVATARDRLADAKEKAARIAEQVPLDLLGVLRELPAGRNRIPWDGPHIRVIEHQAHAPGHAALLIEHCGVLVAGDMLSDVEIPLLDLNDSVDPIGNYLTALDFLEGVAGQLDVVVPGHGSTADRNEARARLERDRAYVRQLAAGREPDDPRVGPAAAYGTDWLPGEHRRQVEFATGRTS
jgi:glyoxylase-like metal-dependent hydrolase (beta-lactamase superfamily II)